jgi:hypothetical protein
MSEQQQQKAVVVKSVTFGDRVFNLSSKGAVTIYHINGRFIDSLKPSTAKLLGDTGCEPLKNLLESDEAKVIAQNREDNKILVQLQKDEAKALAYAKEAEAMFKAIQEMKQRLGKVG